MYRASAMRVDDLRIEIAVLQEIVSAFSQRIAKFRIPVIMNTDTVTNVSNMNTNVMNKRNGNIGSSQLNIDNTIELLLPFEHTFSYGKDTIPVGTRFLVAFVGANINDAKIIGRYDQSNSELGSALASYIIELINLNGVKQDLTDKFTADLSAFSNDVNEHFEDIGTAISTKYSEQFNYLHPFQI